MPLPLCSWEVFGWTQQVVNCFKWTGGTWIIIDDRVLSGPAVRTESNQCAHESMLLKSDRSVDGSTVASLSCDAGFLSLSIGVAVLGFDFLCEQSAFEFVCAFCMESVFDPELNSVEAFVGNPMRMWSEDSEHAGYEPL
jgi:hypothetical protein